MLAGSFQTTTGSIQTPAGSLQMVAGSIQTTVGSLQILAGSPYTVVFLSSPRKSIFTSLRLLYLNNITSFVAVKNTLRLILLLRVGSSAKPFGLPSRQKAVQQKMRMILSVVILHEPCRLGTLKYILFYF